MSKISTRVWRASLLDLGGGNGQHDCLALRYGRLRRQRHLSRYRSADDRASRKPNLSVLKVDVRTEDLDLPAGPFDLVLRRATLHQVSDASRICTLARA
jgi:hypothetical protein